MKLKKVFKIIIGILVFLTLPTVLLFTFIHFKYSQPIPNGTEGKEADALATKMLISLNYEAYKNTDYIEWTFKNRRRYKWNKTENTCDVFWKNYKVTLNLNDQTKSDVFVHGFTIKSDLAKDILNKARAYYKKDLFWLIAPFRIFDFDATRKIVTTKNNKKALLVTYDNNETYLWNFDDAGHVKSFNMWNDITPINGLEVSWNDWTVVQTGVKLPTSHKFLFFDFNISDVKAN